MKLSIKHFKNLPNKEKRFTLATFFTLLRGLAAPFIIWAMACQHWGYAFWLIVFASFTDLIDGFLARNFNQKTFLGACLDPIADKILILSCYFSLAFYQSPLFMIPFWFLFLILLKEFLLIGFAFFIWASRGSLKVEPTLLGKSTMFVQVLFIIWVFACYFFHWLPVKTYHSALGIVLILVLSSLVQYATIGYRYFFSAISAES